MVYRVSQSLFPAVSLHSAAFSARLSYFLMFAMDLKD